MILCINMTHMKGAGPGEPSRASKPIVAKPRKLAPKIDRKNLNKVQVREGEPFFFDVKMIGEPPPTVEWTLNGRPLIETPDKRVVDVPYNTKLYNDSPVRKDSGTYRIVASNKWGEDTAEVEVVVISKPSAPEGPLEVSNIKKDGCKLKWKEPLDSGGIPLANYIVEKYDKDSGIWIPVGKTKDTELDVEGLVQGHEYSFRVKAQNVS